MAAESGSRRFMMERVSGRRRARPSVTPRERRCGRPHSAAVKTDAPDCTSRRAVRGCRGRRSGSQRRNGRACTGRSGCPAPAKARHEVNRVMLCPADKSAAESLSGASSSSRSVPDPGRGGKGRAHRAAHSLRRVVRPQKGVLFPVAATTPETPEERHTLIGPAQRKRLYAAPGRTVAGHLPHMNTASEGEVCAILVAVQHGVITISTTRAPRGSGQRGYGGKTAVGTLGRRDSRCCRATARARSRLPST